MKVDVRKGRVAVPSSRTLNDVAAEWLAGVKVEPPVVLNRSQLPYKPSAVRGYEADLRRYVLDDLGALKLTNYAAPTSSISSTGCAARDSVNRRFGTSSTPSASFSATRSSEGTARRTRRRDCSSAAPAPDGNEQRRRRLTSFAHSPTTCAPFTPRRSTVA